MANILSLFDGMACGMLAMQEAGIEVDRYVAYEIDKYAVQTSTHNFPMIEHRGDVFAADFTEFEGFDYLVGGSPCTYWSIAQKNNRETEASGLGWELFSQYVRALHEAKPKFFIYENNKSMSKAIRASIDEAFGFEAVCINSALVSAQNRQRLYWVGKRNADGSYSKVPVEQPEDRGILLRDVIDGLCWRDKAYTIDSNYHKTLEQQGFETQSGRRKMAVEPVRVGALPRPNGELSTTQSFRVYSVDGKSVNLTAGGGGAGGKTGLYAIPCNDEAVGVGYRNRREEDGKLYRRFETHGEAKANALTTVQTDSMVAIPKAISAADGKEYPVYEVRDGKITIKGREYPIKLADGFYIIRKLTVNECMRLQTVPEWYEFPVSDTQAYKMLGNGWTVSIISHLIEATTEEDT